MLKELLHALTGSITNVGYINPTANGVASVNIPPGATFAKIFKGMLGTLSGSSVGAFGNTSAQQIQNYGASIQAYTNNNGYQQQFFNGGNSQIPTREAFTPGAVINNLVEPPLPQQFNNTGASAISQLATVSNPIQGYAGQAGSTQGNFPAGGFGQGTPGGFAAGFIPGQGMFGKFSVLIMPIVGLFGVLKSLFGFRGMSSLQPVQINKEAIDYKESIEAYAREEAENEGSFDGSYVEQEQNVDFGKLET